MSQKEKYALLLFLFFAFLIPIFCIMMDDFLQMKEISILWFGIQAASPSLAAIFSVTILGKGKGLRSFFHQMFAPSLSISTVLKACILPFGFMLLTFLICAFIFQEWDLMLHIPTAKWIVLLWALFAEEWGWRGFLQPLLEKFCKRSYVSVFVGILWALWHYHFVIVKTFDAPITLFFITCIIESYIYFWLSKKGNGNVLVAMLFHFTYNLSMNLFCISPSLRQGSEYAYVILTLIEFGFLIWISKQNPIVVNSNNEHLSM